MCWPCLGHRQRRGEWKRQRETHLTLEHFSLFLLRYSHLRRDAKSFIFKPFFSDEMINNDQSSVTTATNFECMMKIKLTVAWTSPAGEQWTPRLQGTRGSRERAPMGEECGEYLQVEPRQAWVSVVHVTEKSSLMKYVLPVFGSRISGDRCDGGVPGEKCSLL